MKGVFITFEGTEGSGKSSQIRFLADRLRAAGRTVRSLREPGGTPIGEEIRHTLKHSPHNQAMTPEAELLLLNASRAQLVREAVDFAVGNTRPDLTVLLTVPLATSEARRQIREAGSAPLRDRFEEADRDFFRRVENGYLSIAAAEPARVYAVDSTQPPDRVGLLIWDRVEPLLA